LVCDTNRRQFFGVRDAASFIAVGTMPPGTTSTTAIRRLPRTIGV